METLLCLRQLIVAEHLSDVPMRNGNKYPLEVLILYFSTFGCPYEEWKLVISSLPVSGSGLSDVPMRNGNFEARL